MKTNPFLNIVTLFMIFVLCASCSSQDDAKVPHANSESIDATPEITIYETSSAVVISSLYELTQVSDIVVIGRVQSEEGIINTARFPADNSKPDPRYFTLALVYKVEVVEYLKGEADSIIYVAQKQGKFLHGETPNPDKLQQALNNAENHGYLPLKHNREYLIFLRGIDVWEDYMISGIKPGNLFVRAAHPWRFDVTDKDKVIVEDEITDLGGIFPPQSLSELIKQMTSPPIQTRPPYPAPLEDLQIKTEPTQGSTDLPYPSP